MEQYPETMGAKHAPLGRPCIAFYKYDGSNLRWEWNPKRGWHKMGTRTELFSEDHPLWGQAVPLFDEIKDDIVSRVRAEFRDVQRITAFTEFFGKSSFAGTHMECEQKELRLFDVYLFKKGMMPGKWFLDVFGDADYAAEPIYIGNLNQPFIQDVREGKYPVWEGVVAKGDGFQVKIKTNAYLAKLKEVFGHRWEKFGE